MRRKLVLGALALSLAPLAAAAVTATGSILPKDGHFAGYQEAAQRVFDAISGAPACGYASAAEDPMALVATCRLAAGDRYCGPVANSNELVCFVGPGEARVVSYEYFGTGLIMHWEFVSDDRARAQLYEDAIIGLFMN